MKMPSGRTLIKYISWALTSLRSSAAEQIVILMYHRVTGDVDLELDLKAADFEAQMRWLASTGRVLALDEAMRMAATGTLQGQTWYVLTFDDAYEDFYTRVLPLVRELELPVTLYVPTGFLDAPTKPPISRNVSGAERLRPITWPQLREIGACPRVTIGGHTHSHRELPSLSDAEVLADVRRCDEFLAQLFGAPVRHFAYPRGVWNERVERVLEGRYETIAHVGGGGLQLGSFNAQRLPRIPVLRSDGVRWFRARLAGRLALEEQLVSWVKRFRLRTVRKVSAD